MSHFLLDRFHYDYRPLRHHLRPDFAVPESPLAQLRNVIGWYLISTAISLALLNICGDSWRVVTLAVTTSIAAMQFTRTVHPHAGDDPLVIIITHAPWSFIAVPVLVGAMILVCCGVLTNNLSRDRHYPK